MADGLTSRTMTLAEELAYDRAQAESPVSDWGAAHWQNEIERREEVIAERERSKAGAR